MLVGQLLDRRYRVIKVLNSSAFGEKFLAADTRRPGYPQCIVKQLQLPSNGSGSSQLIKLLLKKKAEILERLGENPQIPQLLAYFEDNQAFYLVEEFIPGRSLSDEIIRAQPWPEERAVAFLQEVLEILAFIHERGVIHREIKPDNFIRRQTDSKLVLINFSLVKEINSQIAKHKPEQMTIQEPSPYIPMEQSQGNVHFSSDIYALGTMGMQVLTGLSGEELLRLRAQDANEEINWRAIAEVKNGSLPKNISPQLIDIIEKMVRFNFAARYQSATEVLEDLQKLTAIPEVVEPPPVAFVVEPKQVVEKPNNHQKTLLGVAGVFVGAIIVALLSRVPQSMTANYLAQQGESNQAKEEHKAAIASFNQAIAVNPQDAQIYFHRAMSHYRLANWQNALQDFTKAVQLDAKNAKAYHYRGNSRMYLGDDKGAIDDYNQAMKVDPSFAPPYLSRGNVRADTGDEKGAIDDYNQAILLDPNFAAAYLNRCLSYSNLGEQKAAIADCSQAIFLNPNSAFAYQNRGLARFRLRDFRGAIEDFNISIRFNPQDADPYYNRGLVRYEMGDKQGAIADYNLAINLNPLHALVYYDRGLVYADLKDQAKAMSDFQLSAKLCSEQGRTGCYKDAQYQIDVLKTQKPTPK